MYYKLKKKKYYKVKINDIIKCLLEEKLKIKEEWWYGKSKVSRIELLGGN